MGCWSYKKYLSRIMNIRSKAKERLYRMFIDRTIFIFIKKR